MQDKEMIGWLVFIAIVLISTYMCHQYFWVIKPTSTRKDKCNRNMKLAEPTVDEDVVAIEDVVTKDVGEGYTK